MVSIFYNGLSIFMKGLSSTTVFSRCLCVRVRVPVPVPVPVCVFQLSTKYCKPSPNDLIVLVNPPIPSSSRERRFLSKV